ncbi:MAG: hypothetical protein SF052_19180 [Bacteroidia bacterium]|nr:hypothetical protein [Bacteroidia bacterium]
MAVAKATGKFRLRQVLGGDLSRSTRFGKAGFPVALATAERRPDGAPQAGKI